MNKIFNSFFLFIFFFVFITSIDSFPFQDLLRKRDGDEGTLKQCEGEFPINFISYTYSPKVLEPGKNFTEHSVWKSTVEIGEGTIGVMVAKINGEKVFENEEDYCEALKKQKSELQCPIPPGDYDIVETITTDEPTPDELKGQAVEFEMSYELLTKDKSKTLACLEGPVTIKYSS